jgi:hypothetical protein
MFDEEMTEPSGLDNAIDRALKFLEDVDCGSKEYTAIADQLTKLYRMKEIEETLKQKELEVLGRQLEIEATCQLREIEADLKRKELNTPKRVSKDTLVLVAGNLLGIVVILGYEKAHVVTSRAMNFVMKLR